MEDVSTAKALLAEGRRKRQEELQNEEKKRRWAAGGDGGFHSHGGTPIAGWFFWEKIPIYKWMIKGGTAHDIGNPHMYQQTWPFKRDRKPDDKALTFQRYPFSGKPMILKTFKHVSFWCFIVDVWMVVWWFAVPFGRRYQWYWYSNVTEDGSTWRTVQPKARAPFLKKNSWFEWDWPIKNWDYIMTTNYNQEDVLGSWVCAKIGDTRNSGH